MLKTALLVIAALALGPSPAIAQNKSVKIGFVSTLSGPTAVMGNDMRNSFELALDHFGRKMGGIPVEVIYEDDQQRPDVGKQKTDKLIELDKVDFIVGYIWSNVLLASMKSLGRLQDIPDYVKCRPASDRGRTMFALYFSTSWQNDQTPAAVGLYMNQKGVKTAFLLGPNYVAGKDMLAGVASTFKGTIVGQELTNDRPARLLGRAGESEGCQARCNLCILSGHGWRPVPYPIFAVRPQRPNPALHRVHNRRDYFAASERLCARYSRCSGMGQ